MPTIIATVGGSTSNSYALATEAETYFDERIALSPAWDPDDDDGVARLLITATRTLDALFSGHRTMRVGKDGLKYTYVSRKWKGSPATSTQRLAWPRIGLLDRNGNAIASDTLPHELKDAVCEFAGQLKKTDRTLDNDVVAQGVTSVKAGSVAVTFKDEFLVIQLPDAVLNLLPDSWFDDEQIIPAIVAEFDVVSSRPRHRGPGWGR